MAKEVIALQDELRNIEQQMLHLGQQRESLIAQTSTMTTEEMPTENGNKEGGIFTLRDPMVLLSLLT